MTYIEALKWKTANLGLIGSVDKKGFVVSDLMIVPADPKERNVFLQTYLFTENKDLAFAPYTSRDMQVWAVDLSRLESHGILFYDVLTQ